MGDESLRRGGGYGIQRDDLSESNSVEDYFNSEDSNSQDDYFIRYPQQPESSSPSPFKINVSANVVENNNNADSDTPRMNNS
jgi:hypothetical protein